MGPWYPGQRWWCILDYWTQAVHIFHLILKYFKLVLPVTLFRDFSRNVSNLFHFASETCKGSIYRLIVLPTSVVGSASIVSCFFFSGCSGIYFLITPGGFWFVVDMVYSIDNPSEIFDLYLLLFFISIVVRFSIFLDLFWWVPLVIVITFIVSYILTFFMGNLAIFNDLHCLSNSLGSMTVPFFLKL